VKRARRKRLRGSRKIHREAEAHVLPARLLAQFFGIPLFYRTDSAGEILPRARLPAALFLCAAALQ